MRGIVRLKRKASHRPDHSGVHYRFALMRIFQMKTKIIATFLILAMGFAGSALATRDEFCAGFAEGYKTMKGDMVMVPMCPMEPMTPMGSTSFREGIKAGIKAAGG